MRFRSGEIISIPSPIDVHVHLREPGGEAKETIETGTRAALYGGYQGVLDMPNNPGGNETWTEERLDDKYRRAARTALTSIGFYAGVNLADPDVDEMSKMVPKAAGLKLYMGHTTGNVKEYGLDEARFPIDRWIAVAMNLGIMPPQLLHAREGIGEETADYIASRGYPVHWCHLSTETEAKAASRLTKKHGELFTAGVTPHHLTMTSIDADFKYGWPGARMMPPLGKEADHDALLFYFNNGDIKILETDHAPHTEEEKSNAERENPEGNDDPDCTTCFGVSGIEFVLPVMMSFVQRRKIKMERLEDALYTHPAKMLGLDTRTNQNFTDIEIRQKTITEDDRRGQSRNNPYVGWTGWGKVVQVVKEGVPLLNSEGKLAKPLHQTRTLVKPLKYGSPL